MISLRSKKVFVSGSSGFLGKCIVQQLNKMGAEVLTLTRAQCDLTQQREVVSAIRELKPAIIIHAAGFLGGVHFSRLYPAEVLLNNLQIACNIYEAAHKSKVDKLVNVGSACVYSDQLPGPFKEEDMLKLPLHPSVQYYAFSKLALYHAGQAFKEQYGMKSIHLVLANLYGPADKFDPELSHVVSSMVPKFYDATRKNKPHVVCWGSGKTVREFLYVEDCAEAIVRSTVSYEDPEPLNIGVGQGITMRELAEIIASATGFKGEIVWDTSIPDGAMYKVIDTTRMKEILKWEPTTSFKEGLQKTVDWFATHYETWLTKHSEKESVV